MRIAVTPKKRATASARGAPAWTDLGSRQLDLGPPCPDLGGARGGREGVRWRRGEVWVG
jgi:hypothetical protein